MKSKSFWLSVLKYAFGLGALYWVWRTGKLDFSLLDDHFEPMNAIMALAMMALTVIGSIFRLWMIVRSKAPNLKIGDIFRVTHIGMFFNFVIPGGASGDLVKAFYLYKLFPEGRDSLIGGVVTDRMIGLLAMIVVAAGALLVRPEELLRQGDVLTLFLTLVAAGTFLAVLFGTLIKSHHKGGLAQGFLDGFRIVRSVKQKLHGASLTLRTFLMTFLISLGIQGAAVLVMYYLALTTGFHDLDLTALFIVTPVGFIVSAIPIAPAGIGVGQVAFYALYKLYTGKASEVGPTVVTLYQVGMFLFSLPGLWFYLRSSRRTNTPSS